MERFFLFQASVMTCIAALFCHIPESLPYFRCHFFSLTCTAVFPNENKCYRKFNLLVWMKHTIYPQFITILLKNRNFYIEFSRFFTRFPDFLNQTCTNLGPIIINRNMWICCEKQNPTRTCLFYVGAVAPLTTYGLSPPTFRAGGHFLALKIRIWKIKSEKNIF